MHDWKNSTPMLQNQDGAVKVNLKDGKVRPVIPRGSEPSSSTSTAIHTIVESQIPLDLSFDYVMNWMEALATIDCMMMNVEMPSEEMDNDVIQTIPRELPHIETPKGMLVAFQLDELREDEQNQGLLHLCYLVEPETVDEKALWKE